MNIRLLNGKIILGLEMPDIVDLSKDELSFKISNFEKFSSGKLTLRIEYEGGYKSIEIENGEFEIPVSILTKDIKSIRITHLDKEVKSFDANVDKFKIKGIINIADKDKLVDLLGVLYNKLTELEKKYDRLEKIVDEGDLLI